MVSSNRRYSRRLSRRWSHRGLYALWSNLMVDKNAKMWLDPFCKLSEAKIQPGMEHLIKVTKNKGEEGVGHRVEIDKKKLNNWRWRKTEIKHFFHNGKKPPIPVRELSIY